MSFDCTFNLVAFFFFRKCNVQHYMKNHLIATSDFSFKQNVTCMFPILSFEKNYCIFIFIIIVYMHYCELHIQMYPWVAFTEEHLRCVFDKS